MICRRNHCQTRKGKTYCIALFVCCRSQLAGIARLALVHGALSACHNCLSQMYNVDITCSWLIFITQCLTLCLCCHAVSTDPWYARTRTGCHALPSHHSSIAAHLCACPGPGSPPSSDQLLLPAPTVSSASLDVSQNSRNSAPQSTRL